METRFRLHKTADPHEYEILRGKVHAAAPDAVTFPSSSPNPGSAALADVVLIAIISGGASVIAAAIAAFTSYVISKRQAAERSTGKEHAPVIVIIRGTKASERLQVVGQDISREAIEAAVAKVGAVTEVVEAD